MDLSWWAYAVSWTAFVCVIRSQQAFANAYQPNHHDDRGKLLKLAMLASIVVAAIVGLVLTYVHFQAYGLLWTVGLGVGGGVIASAAWGILSATVGDELVALAGFVVWPLLALACGLLLWSVVG